ncbi:ABC transporter substrate-binding protein [Alicyclobacillus fastidiosus]|uniref:ABC transporter substrate-binding protein n=1 Tax=Alicyclobacillus fastidiosus TaxID=392011 RepID=A0ABY6ZCD5_9BACL|nr:ABC transporter substrate-binding protein [Alicyclobacillus fastidiosus]WAH40502.1 ABC transporter substrate-binding protein [Alicyclobacillus fastidiosus]GMA61919.1 ABC transporter substrate-binding protein [Alicyclobacillus fastidiosus]
MEKKRLMGLFGISLSTILLTSACSTIQSQSTTGPVSTINSSSKNQSNEFASSASHPFTAIATWNFANGYNPLETNSLTSWYQSGIVDPPLAWVSRTDVGSSGIIPGVASKWSMDGRTLSIWVNPKAKWSDGTPVTAKDMLLSLQIALYLNQWMGLSVGPMKIVNDQEVQVQEGSVPYPNFMPYVLGYTPVYSYAEFGKFIPSNIYQLFLDANKSGKVGSDASTKITNILTAMEGYKPNYTISCGPWELQSASNSQALFKPNPYFWNAKNIPELELLNGTNASLEYTWAAQSQFTIGGVPNITPNLLNQWLHSDSSHKVIYSTFFGNVGIAFNTSVYPYNQLQLRQAMAYLIDRQDVAHVSNPLMDKAVNPPVPFFDNMNVQTYLTAQQRSQLNPYNYDPAKGEALLKSMGFKRTSNGWVMPNGKPFEPKISAPSTTPAWQEAAEVIKEDLSKVGIQAQVYFPAANIYNTDLEATGSKGMDMAIGWEAFSVRPYNNFADAAYYTAGVNMDYGTQSYTISSGDRGLPKMTDPNGRPVDLAKLAAQTLYTANTEKLKKAIWQISQISNNNLPMLPLWEDYRNVNYIDTQYYTGFPAGNNPFWVIQNNFGPNWAAFFYAGMIKPAK